MMAELKASVIETKLRDELSMQRDQMRFDQLGDVGSKRPMTQALFAKGSRRPNKFHKPKSKCHICKRMHAEGCFFDPKNPDFNSEYAVWYRLRSSMGKEVGRRIGWQEPQDRKQDRSSAESMDLSLRPMSHIAREVSQLTVPCSQPKRSIYSRSFQANANANGTQ